MASPNVKDIYNLFKCPKIPPVENEGVSEPGAVSQKQMGLGMSP